MKRIKRQQNIDIFLFPFFPGEIILSIIVSSCSVVVAAAAGVVVVVLNAVESNKKGEILRKTVIAVSVCRK